MDGSNFLPVVTDIVGTTHAVIDANLGVLQDNGGSTYTHALLDGSPVINAGAITDLLTDQRGTPIIGIKDIGAYEYQSSAPLVIFFLNEDDNIDFTSLEDNSSGYATEAYNLEQHLNQITIEMNNITN